MSNDRRRCVSVHQSLNVRAGRKVEKVSESQQSPGAAQYHHPSIARQGPGCGTEYWRQLFSPATLAVGAAVHWPAGNPASGRRGLSAASWQALSKHPCRVRRQLVLQNTGQWSRGLGDAGQHRRQPLGDHDGGRRGLSSGDRGHDAGVHNTQALRDDCATAGGLVRAGAQPEGSPRDAPPASGD